MGDVVKSDDVLADVETDKATMEVVGYEAGTLLYIGVEAGSAAKINQIIAIVGKPGTDVSAYVAAENAGANATGQTTDNRQPATETATDNAQQPTSNEQQETVSSDQRIKASPLAKKLAAEKGVDLHKVNGSGDNGRITKKDVDSYVPSAAPAAAASTAGGSSKAATPPAFTAIGQEGHTDVELTQMRKVIARRLGESKFSAPHFYLTMEINMDNAMMSRVAMNDVSPV